MNTEKGKSGNEIQYSVLTHLRANYCCLIYCPTLAETRYKGCNFIAAGFYHSVPWAPAREEQGGQAPNLETGWASAHPGKNQGEHGPPWKF